MVVGFVFVTFLKGLILFFFILAALLLTVVVLLQEPKGGGLSSAFGGAGAETFGVQAGGVNKFTSYVAAVYLGLAVLYAAIRPPGALSASDLARPPTPGVGAPAGEPAPPAPPENAGGVEPAGGGNPAGGGAPGESDDAEKEGG